MCRIAQIIGPAAAGQCPRAVYEEGVGSLLRLAGQRFAKNLPSRKRLPTPSGLIRASAVPEPPVNDLSEAPGAQSQWTGICPACHAKVQPAARGCWRCGALISDADTEKPDYRPPLVDPDALSGVSISILIALIFFIPVVLALWAFVSLLNW